MQSLPMVPDQPRIARAFGALSLGAMPGRGLLLAMSAALLAICGIFAVVMADARSDARRVAEAFGLNLATALAQDMARNVELLDLSIQAARDSWDDARVRNLAPDLRQLVVFDHSASAQYIDSIVVIAPDGSVVADSLSAVPRSGNYAGADFFRAQVDQDVGLFVSRPMKIAGKPGWSMAFSRRILDTSGHFAGVAVGILNLEYLSAVYKRLDVGAGGSLFLFNIDGTMLAREPPNLRSVGRSFAGTSAFDGMEDARQGVFEAVSTIDGQSRLYSFHRVGDLPLIQSVAVSTAVVFSEWWRKAIVLGGLLGALCIATLVMFFVLKRELVQRVAAQKALSDLASKDDLTGLLNRRRFFELAEARFADYPGAAVSVLMIDADHFKSYNDRYGHVAGDAVLASLGRCISGELRAASDVAARFGGEEFIVLLAGAGRDRAFLIAEAIRSAVAGLATAHERTVAGIVTVSVGVASGRTGAAGGLSALVEAADSELYRSKRAGRNRSSSAERAVVAPVPQAPAARSA